MKLSTYASTTALALLASLCLSHATLAGDDQKMPPPKTNAAFQTIQGLTGEWVGQTDAANAHPGGLVFKVTSMGTAVVETMAPGTKYEMTNVYTPQGDSVVMTHYCGMGNQPRMKLSSMKDGVLKFEFVDGGNIKSRNDAHMDSLEITISGNNLTEHWSLYQDGQVVSTEDFKYTRKA